ncbi:MAG: DUF1566 domain-containing protein [Treponema sp.]|jgi:TolB-like protein|nr:DUF1566 domain-containing protein [Treponema sp.]
MKKNSVMKLSAALVVMLMIAGGCGSKPSVPKVDDLDTAIRDASNYLNDNIPNGSKIVILNIQSSSPDLSDYIIDELLANAVNDKIFSVVDRQQLDAIRAEQNFQFSGEVDDNSAMEIGKFFGAQTIVSGALSRLGNAYRIRIRALEVQTAQVQGQYNRNIATSQIITDLVGGGGSPAGGTATAAPAASSDGLTISGLSAYRDSYVLATFVDNKLALMLGANVSDDLAITAARISGDSVTLKGWGQLRNSGKKIAKYNGNDKNIILNVAIVNKEQFARGENVTPYAVQRGTVTANFTNGRGSGIFVASAAPAAPATPAQVYKVGDTGPAGGLIFYDKGNNSGGWRYLEAAPVEAEFQAQWSVRSTGVDNTQETVGSGKRNTQLIVEKFKQTSGEWDTAAQKCDDLEFGGFDDWFMPSRAELDQMYGNLKRKNLGDFKNGWYWSSTQSESGYARMQDFSDNDISTSAKYNNRYVRPIRQF